MNILITGGMGYIGSRMTVRMRQENWRVTLLDRACSESFKPEDKSIRLFEIEASDKLCESIFTDSYYDLVIHLACDALISQDSADLTETIHNNLSAIENVLYLSLRAHIGKVIVLFDSSIYGTGTEHTKTEVSSLLPDTLTGRQELLRSKLCEAYSRQGLDVVQLRTGLVYGPSTTNCPDVFSLQHQVLPILSPDNDSYTRSSVGLMNDTKLLPPREDSVWQFGHDFIHINDLLEAIIRICLVDTSPIINIGSGRVSTIEQYRAISKIHWLQSERLFARPQTRSRSTLINQEINSRDNEAAAARNGYCLDYSQASFELGWSPRYQLDDGLAATIRHQALAQDRIINDCIGQAGVNETDRLNKFASSSKRTIIVLAWFVAAVLANFLIEYRLGLEVDMLVPYFLLISSIYGSQQGYFAAGLAALARLGFTFIIEDASVIRFVQGANGPLYLVFYFLLTMLICKIVDRSRERQTELRLRIDDLSHEKEHLKSLYMSSLKIKETLQRTITETEESFSRIQYVLKQFNDVPPDSTADVTVKVVSEILKTPLVSLYILDSTGNFLQRIAGESEQIPELLYVHDHSFLEESIRLQKTQINTDMETHCPLVCAPIPTGDKSTLLIFLDGIDLTQLNQHYLNTLESLLQLVSNYLHPQIHREIWAYK